MHSVPLLPGSATSLRPPSLSSSSSSPRDLRMATLNHRTLSTSTTVLPLPFLPGPSASTRMGRCGTDQCPLTAIVLAPASRSLPNRPAINDVVIPLAVLLDLVLAPGRSNPRAPRADQQTVRLDLLGRPAPVSDCDLGLSPPPALRAADPRPPAFPELMAGATHGRSTQTQGARSRPGKPRSPLQRARPCCERHACPQKLGEEQRGRDWWMADRRSLLRPLPVICLVL